jgi:hypothetical protein
MGASAKSFVTNAMSGNRRGIALASGILSLVAVGVLVTGLYAMSDLGSKAVKNREASSRAMHIAEAGAAHALGTLRKSFRPTYLEKLIAGADNIYGTADDGVLYGFPQLTAATSIYASGRSYSNGTYFVRIKDDPADPNPDPSIDGNYRILLECRGTTADGASADLNVVAANVVLPGVAVDGNLEISGKVELSGECGGAHINGTYTGSGQPTATLHWQSVGGTIPAGYVGVKRPGAVPMEIPDLNPLQHCPSGTPIINTLPPLAALNGVYCVNGDVIINGDIASLLSPKNVTIIATGSIKISGKPFFRAAHPEGFVLLAGGDLDLQGDGGYEGVSYCGGQTYISAKPTFTGQLVCKNKVPHPGSNFVPANLISGDGKIKFECGSTLNRAYRSVAWYPAHGS